MAEEALTVELDIPKRESNAKFESERQAFWAQYHELLKHYNGRYVAIHEGRVVDHDEDEQVLIRRVYQTLGYIPVYIQIVRPEGLPRYYMPTFFVKR